MAHLGFQPQPTRQQQATSALANLPEFSGSLKFVSDLGGSTGAQLVETSQGNRLVKKMGDSPAHVVEEHAADSVYRAMGAPVPRSNLYRDATGSPMKLSQWVDGEELGEHFYKSTPEQQERIKQQLGKHFVLEALLGNYDVIGMACDNVKVSPDGQVYRIDNGGSFRFSASGKIKKQRHGGRGAWEAGVNEIETMRDPFINPQGAKFFGGITDNEIIQQAADIVARKDTILNAVPADLRDKLAERIDWLKAHYVDDQAFQFAPHSIYAGRGANWRDVPPQAGNVYRPETGEETNPMFKEYSKNDVEANLDMKDLPASFLKHQKTAEAALHPEDRAAVEAYTGNAHSDLNRQMRDCPETLDCLDPPQRKMAEQIQKAIASAGKFERPINLWRSINLYGKELDRFASVAELALASGADIRMPGFKSAAFSPDGFSGESTLRIRAKSGLLVEKDADGSGITRAPGEKEVLQGHNVRYRVTGMERTGSGVKIDMEEL
jgi:hypothetical protein